MADGSATVPEATAIAAGSLEADAGVADTTPESVVDKSVVLKEQTMLPQASKGVVRHAIRPPSPLVVPSDAEEDEVEEIEHEESCPQAIQILRKWDDEVVVVEDTTRELRRLESTHRRR